MLNTQFYCKLNETLKITRTMKIKSENVEKNRWNGKLQVIVENNKL